MAFKLTGTMQVVQVAKTVADLNGFALAAQKSGFDLAAAAKSKGFALEASNDKVLFFRAKMLGYDLPNGNGDSIPRIYASAFGPSFIGTHLDVNHETDPANIIGKVLATFHVEVPIVAGEGEERIIGKNALALSAEDDGVTNELQLEGICMIDRTISLGDDIAKKLISGILTSVSQEASTDYAECSVCGHRINNPYETICAHMNNGSLMMESYQVEGRKHKVLAYKVHHNPVGTGLGVVTVPAYEKAKVSDLVAKIEEKTLVLTAADKSKGRFEVMQLVEGGPWHVVENGPQNKMTPFYGPFDTEEDAQLKLDNMVTAGKKVKASNDGTYTVKEKDKSTYWGEYDDKEDAEAQLKHMQKSYPDKAFEIAPREHGTFVSKRGMTVKLTAAKLKALQLDELQPNATIYDPSGNSWKVVSVGIDDKERFAMVSPDEEPRVVLEDELATWNWTSAPSFEARLDAAITLLDLSKTYTDINAMLNKVLNVSASTGLLLSGSRLQGGEAAVMRVAGVAADAGQRYKACVSQFWMHASELDPQVKAVIAAKSGDKAEKVGDLAKNLSAEAKAIAPDNLVALTHISRAAEADELFSALARALKLRAFVVKALPTAFGVEYNDTLKSLSAAAKKKDVEASRRHAAELAKLEAGFAERTTLSYGREGILTPLILRSGFIAGAEAFAKTADDSSARTMLAFLLPQTSVQSYFIPAGKSGYTLTIDAHGKATRAYETASLTATLKGLKMQSARLEDMGADQLQLLKKAWLEAKANVEKQGADAEVLSLIGDEIARIDTKLEETAIAAGQVVEAKTPPDVSEKTMHKLKKEYGSDKAGKAKAYATAWAIAKKAKTKKKG